jgi:hypothetical protein
MTITIDIRPEVQAELARQAAARGQAMEAVAAALLEEAVHLPANATPAHGRFDNLSDLLLNSPFAGAGLNLERSKDPPRPVDLR